MTDVFNIDSETEGFRKNKLDWRKFRENYNRVSASKVERGIKPLPLSLLLRLFGPQKVLNTYVVTRRVTNELDNYPAKSNDSQSEMKTNETDRAVAKTLNFPGNGTFQNSTGEGKLAFKKSSASTKPSKHSALPPRPAFQRNIHVPGRYFPKPTPTDEYGNLSSSYTESIWERPRTQTPRAVHVYTPGSTSLTGGFKNNAIKTKSVGLSRKSKLIRGTACKATETLSPHPSRPPTLSGKSATTIRSVQTASSNEYIQSKGGVSGIERMDGSGRSDTFSISFRTDDRESFTGNANYDPHSELHSDYNTVKRTELIARQVSFPKGSVDFSTVLQGRPKTLHRREFVESLEAQTREPRARTHVGFVDKENT